jgi:transposase
MGSGVLTCYLHRIRSSRRLEQETHRNVGLMWLLRRLTPDFKTIAGFRRDHPKALKGVCREFILLCRRLDLFRGELLAIDGSKFRAVNARHRSYTPARLAKLQRDIARTIARSRRPKWRIVVSLPLHQPCAITRPRAQ